MTAGGARTARREPQGTTPSSMCPRVCACQTPVILCRQFSIASVVHGSPPPLPALLALGPGSPSKILPRISRVRAAMPVTCHAQSVASYALRACPQPRSLGQRGVSYAGHRLPDRRPPPFPRRLPGAGWLRRERPPAASAQTLLLYWYGWGTGTDWAASLAMTASFGPTVTASSGSTWRSADALIWPHPRLPRSPIVAGAHRRSRSYVLASLRALHLDLRLVASDRAAVEEGGIPGRQHDASPRWGHFRPTSDLSDLAWGHFKPGGFQPSSQHVPVMAGMVATTG